MGDITKTLKCIAVIVGVGFTLFAVLETLQAYSTLRDINP